MSIPQRLEDGVVEAEAEQVLHGLLPEVVVDPEDLVLVQLVVQGVVELARAREVVAEGLLDHDAAEGRILQLVTVEETRHDQVAYRPGEEIGAEGQIEEPRHLGAAGGRQRVEIRTQAAERGGVVDVAAAIEEAGRQRVEGLGGGGVHRLPQLLAKRVVGVGAATDGDHLHALREMSGAMEPDERRHELLPREISAPAEDHELNDRVDGLSSGHMFRPEPPRLQAAPARGGRAGLTGKRAPGAIREAAGPRPTVPSTAFLGSSRPATRHPSRARSLLRTPPGATPTKEIEIHER